MPIHILTCISLASAIACGSGPINQWWPLRVGDRSTMRNPANGARTFIEISTPPSELCDAPQFVLRFTKDSPDTYWGTGGTMSLEWSLRVAEDGTIWSPMAFWHASLDCSGPVTQTWRTPQDLIVPAGPTRFEMTEHYRQAFETFTSCGGGGDFGPEYWVTEAEQVGDELRVRYVEGIPETQRCGGFGERWTFRRSVGLIRVEWAAPDCSIGMTERE